jgi:hypothetical protein
MSNEYKQMLKALGAYVLGFWAFSYGLLLLQKIATSSESPVKTLFYGEAGIYVGCFWIGLMAVVFSVPFYIWSVIRYSMLKDKFYLDSYYKRSFFAGIVAPFAIYLPVVILFALRIRSSLVCVAMVVLASALLAEASIKINVMMLRKEAGNRHA